MSDTFKKIAFLVAKPGLTSDAFSDHWRNRHGPLVSNSPGYARWRSRYVQNHVQGPGPVGSTLGFAGMAEFWLPGQSPSEEDFSATSTYRDHIEPDERRFIDMDRTVSMTAIEDVVVPGHAPGGPVKLVVLSRRADAIGAAELRQRYATQFVAAVLAVPAFATRLRGWSANHVLEGSYRLPGGRTSDALSVDVIDELWFDSAADIAEAFKATTFTSPLLSDAGRQSFVASEHVFFDGGHAV
jgi:uncharacterized protein (TIGR02118 family)